MPNTTAAIMAIPGPLERVRLVGDEDKHATLLYFGETATLPDGAKDVLVSSVKLAASMLMPFRESVIDIARLGSDNPPALVALLSNEKLGLIRNLFMVNPEVKSYLDNTQQFPQFTPHMTLAYPDFTEEVILRTLARQIYGIQFDRLSVWWNDERIDVALSNDIAADTVAMSDQIDNFMAHASGGMQHWGVRKDQSGSGDNTFQLTGLFAPKPGQTFVYQGSTYTVISAKKTSKVTFSVQAKTAKQKADSNVQHSEFEFEFLEDDSVLEHHGVKGMKWGVRRRPDPSTGLVPRGSSADQISQDRILKKIKIGGIDSLSNADIQSFTKRLQLEQDLSRALATQSAAQQKKSDGFIKSFVKSQGGRQFDRVANKAIDVAIEKALGKAGTKIEVKNPGLGKGVQEVANRLKPKKK